MQIWDTAGQERYRSITRSYYHGAHGIILCYALNNRESFERLEYWMKEIKENASDGVCIVLAGTRSDLPDERVVSIDEGRQFAELYGIKFFETSAKENANIDEVFLTLTRDISKILCENSDLQPSTQIKPRENGSKSGNNCSKCS